jgi:hypothetical protein
VQFWQATPPAPHAVSWAPVAQMSPMQQPAQLAALQPTTGVHTPASHVSFRPHAVHALPPEPHAPGLVAMTHVLPEQQPGQFFGPHVTGVWQVRSFGWPRGAQTLPVAAQSAQAWPPFPQAVASPPVTHVVPSQQPPQFAGPHVGVPWQAPPPPGTGSHFCPRAWQLSHARPLVPHAV